MADVAAPNLGLLSGLGEGLKQGLISYQNMQNINRTNQMQNMLMGVQKNADSGQLEYTPQKAQQMQAQSMAEKRSMDELDPNSDVSQRLGAMRGQIVHSADPKASADMFQGSSAADQKEMEGLLKPDISGQYGILKQLYSPMVQVKQGQLDVARDNQASSAVDKVTNDSQMKSHVQRVQGADRILGQLDAAKSGKIVDTNQLLNDINTEYVNLLTGSNNSALGKQERTEYTTMAGNLAATLQKIKGSPESINSPEILGQLETQVRDLKGNYQGQIKARGQMLQRNYAHNPNATQAQQDKIAEMTNQFGGGDQPQGQGLLGAQAPMPHPQDAAAVQWAQANPKDPRSAAILKANGAGQ